MGGGGRKITKKIFQSTWKTELCKIKKYLNYILMIINQNILAILRTFSNLQKKKLWKTLHQGDNFQKCYYWISSQSSYQKENTK